MKKLTESKLLAGFIYGDHHTKEYVYLPGSELGADIPVLVYETDEGLPHARGGVSLWLYFSSS